MKRLVWIASYPKSGNTWFRALLANADPERQEPAPLDRLGSGVAGARARFDTWAGVESADLTSLEEDALRSPVWAWEGMEAPGEDLIFRKLHDAFHSPFDGAPSVPVEVSRGAIYLARDPRDVAVSYANHRGGSVADAVQAMADEGHGLAGGPSGQLAQHLGSWSSHVEGWLSQDQVAVHLVRYEDLHSHPVDSFAAALSFVGLDIPPWAVERAVEWSRFERLQSMEQKEGFFEKPPSSPAFFRAGTAGRWRDELTAELVQDIEERHAPVMDRLGYPLSRRAAP